MGIFIPSYPRGFAGTNYPRKSWPKKRPAAATFMFKSEDVWAAAAAAMRVNGEYLKEPQFKAVLDSEGYQQMVQTKEANKVMVRKMLGENQGWTDEDVSRGATAREYWQSQLLKIVGGTANDFEQTAISIANKEQIETSYDVAVVASLIASAERNKTKDAANDVKLQTNSKHVGTVGEKIELTNAEVLAVSGLTDFGKYRVDVKCEGNLYTWWSGKSYKSGDWVSVKGKVKGHVVDRGTNVAVTQLNYVKEV